MLGFQDRVVARVIEALPLHLDSEELARADIGGTTNPDAFDAYLRAWQSYNLRTSDGFLAAVDLLERAVALDENYGRAFALLASIHFEAWQNFWHHEFGYESEVERRFLKRTAERYLNDALRNPSVFAHLVATRLLRADGRIVEMQVQARKALAIDPNDPDAYYALALANFLAGETDAALQDIEHAMALDRYFPPRYRTLRGGILFMLGEHEKAAELLERAFREDPESRDALMFLIATLGELGRPMDREHKEIRRWGERMDRYAARWRFEVPEDWEKLANGLRKGLPRSQQ